ncbi:MAG: thioredoxin family protein [Minisyncoccia bacterium]
MSKSTGIVIGIIALVVVISGIYSSMSNKNDVIMEKEKMEQQVVVEDDQSMMKKDIVVTLSALNASGQAGKATFSEMSGKTKVMVEVSGSVTGVPQPSHIHVGEYSAPGAIVYPLSAVVNGKAETILDVSLETLGEKLPLTVMVHKSKDEVKTFVSGGNLPKDFFGAMIGKEATSMMEKSDTMMKAGSYESYASEKVMLASTTNDVVLFFRASWCPTCRAVDSDIKANLSQIPSNLTILDINYDTATALKQKYGVTYQHTFVQVDKDGNMIKKWSGSPTLSALVSEVK